MEKRRVVNFSGRPPHMFTVYHMST